jgi:hypothetical protein
MALEGLNMNSKHVYRGLQVTFWWTHKRKEKNEKNIKKIKKKENLNRNIFKKERGMIFTLLIIRS